jgi:hypothetical protein
LDDLDNGVELRFRSVEGDSELFNSLGYKPKFDGARSTSGAGEERTQGCPLLPEM